MAASIRLGAHPAELRRPKWASARSWTSSVRPRASRFQYGIAPVRSSAAESCSIICTRGVTLSSKRRSP